MEMEMIKTNIEGVGDGEVEAVSGWLIEAEFPEPVFIYKPGKYWSAYKYPSGKRIDIGIAISRRRICIELIRAFYRKPCAATPRSGLLAAYKAPHISKRDAGFSEDEWVG